MRPALYTLAWLACTAVMAADAAILAAIALIYTVLGPFSGVYVGARLGAWCGLGLFGSTLSMLLGLGLFASVRDDLGRLFAPWWASVLGSFRRAAALRAGLWRSYRRDGNWRHP